MIHVVDCFDGDSHAKDILVMSLLHRMDDVLFIDTNLKLNNLIETIKIEIRARYAVIETLIVAGAPHVMRLSFPDDILKDVKTFFEKFFNGNHENKKSAIVVRNASDILGYFVHYFVEKYKECDLLQNDDSNVNIYVQITECWKKFIDIIGKDGIDVYLLMKTRRDIYNDGKFVKIPDYATLNFLMQVDEKRYGGIFSKYMDAINVKHDRISVFDAINMVKFGLGIIPKMQEDGSCDEYGARCIEKRETT